VSLLAAQLPVLPIAIPLMVGSLLIIAGRRWPAGAAAAGLLALLANLGCAVALWQFTADGTVLPYLLGNWSAPFGIVLAIDRLAVLMLGVTAVVALACQLAALDGPLRQGPAFPALLQFQLMGLNGAFLTSDLFNLFVFFEVLLISSYALLLHRADRGALRAGLHYVIVNLLGSALFLIAVSLLYGTLGTLNMADLAARVPLASAADQPLVAAAGALLLVVFGIKAAALPLGLWLPGTYPAAPAPVAVLFAVMTKVGIYAIARVSTLIYGAGAGALAGFASPLLLYTGLATIIAGTLGTLAARSLRRLTAWLVVASAGTLLAALGSDTAASAGAALLYLPHTTFAAAALFLVAGTVAVARGPDLEDRIEVGNAPGRGVLLGSLFLFTAVAIAGIPPLSGFVAKLIVLDAVSDTPRWPLTWSVLLASSLAAVVALSRAGSTIFWKSPPSPQRVPVGRGALAALALLAAAGLAIVLWAGPLAGYMNAAGEQLAAPSAYISAVLAATGWVAP
jgi:multicomponent K+:H+ antiporter subunit D